MKKLIIVRSLSLVMMKKTTLQVIKRFGKRLFFFWSDALFVCLFVCLFTINPLGQWKRSC